MRTRPTIATMARVLRQLRRDPRTVALLLLVPVVLESLVKWIFAGKPEVFQRVGVPLLGIFPLTSMFVVTSIAMLRERTAGTLERLMAMPIAKLELLAGYLLGFGCMALLQGAITSAVAFGLLGLETEGPVVAVVAIAVLNAIMGTALGLFVSAFASSEFQAVQFLPAFLLPQFLLSGLLAPRSSMEPALEAISSLLPVTYAYDALGRVQAGETGSNGLLVDLAVLIGVTVLGVVLGAATLRRRTA